MTSELLLLSQDTGALQYTHEVARARGVRF